MLMLMQNMSEFKNQNPARGRKLVCINNRKFKKVFI